MSLTDFKAKMNKSKINKYKINNNNKTNTKHEFNVKYERYKQDISKDTLQMQKKV
jgi:site-specific DNA-adenine methylase